MRIYTIFLLMFVILLIYSFYGSFNYNLYEGMNTGNQVCPSNKNERALFMALKNSAQIASINDKIKSLSNLDDRFTKIENKVKINHEGIQNLTNQLTKFTTSLGNKK